MRILHILNDGHSKLPDQIIGVQSKEHEVRVVDLSKKEVSYEDIIDAVFSYDRVVSW
jgi:hypothetical protein